MKSRFHATTGVIAFLAILALLTSTVLSHLFGNDATVATVKRVIFFGLLGLVPLQAIVGASGMSLLGKRTDSLVEIKQKRAPAAFMTSLLILLPAGFFLKSRAADGAIDGMYYAVEGLVLVAAAVAVVLVGLNIRDGLILSGKIAAQGGPQSDSTSGIDERDGGPLVASALPALLSSEGEAIPHKQVAALCRCGASKKKPFCDGSHVAIGFDSKPSSERTKDEILTYEGKEVTVYYNRLLCSHAAECGSRQKAAFDSSRKPWIVPDNAAAQDIIEVVKCCPSGALRYSLPGEAPQHVLSEAPGVTVEENGPYRVVGVPLASARLASGASAQKYVLCRCGASKNKPYCDGSHVDIGWKDANP